MPNEQKDPKPGDVVTVRETCRRGCCTEALYRATFQRIASNGTYECTIGDRPKTVSPFDVIRIDTYPVGT